jgi:hypothetical protein
MANEFDNGDETTLFRCMARVLVMEQFAPFESLHGGSSTSGRSSSSSNGSSSSSTSSSGNAGGIGAHVGAGGGGGGAGGAVAGAGRARTAPSGSGGTWRELKSPATVRILRNDASGDIRCVVKVSDES